MKKLLKPQEISQILGIGRNKTYLLLSTNSIENIRIGKSIRVTEESLEEYIRSIKGESGRKVIQHDSNA